MTLRLPLAVFALAMSASVASAQNVDALRKACAVDALKLCPTVAPGEGRLAQCLIVNAKQVSPGCLQAMSDAVAAQIKATGN
jgi:Cysteine rich repeat